MRKFTSSIFSKPLLALAFSIASGAVYAQANDACSSAISLNINSNCVPTTGTTTGASVTEPGLADPSCSDDFQGADVWYSFQASDSGALVTVSSQSLTSTSDYWEYGVSVYSGTCGALTEVGCASGYFNQFFGSSPALNVLSGLTPGATYLVRVFQDYTVDENGDQVSNPANMNFSICVTPAPQTPNCVSYVSPGMADTGITSATIFAWNSDPNAATYDLYLGTTQGAENYYGTVSDTTYNVSGLDYSSTYYWYVIPTNALGSSPIGCDANEMSFQTGAAPPPPSNDNAGGAITLTVGAPCTGNGYSNESATLGTGEPYANCNDVSEGEHSVWFKFVAPLSGSVKITTDIGPLGSLSDTKIGLFSATDSSNYSTFNIIACDDDNGIIGDGYASTIFTTSLTAGQTYYVEVDGFGAGDYGTFCLEVQEINPTMLATSASCTDIQSPEGAVSNYTGWVTLVDENGYLVANVRNAAGGEPDAYGGSYNIDGNGTGIPRQDGNGAYYLSRNYTITNTVNTTPVDVRFYFQPAEIATLAGITANATNLSNLNVTRQESDDCHPNFSDSNGVTSVLTQTDNGSVNGVSWIQVTTSSFSNFYLMGGTTPLPIRLSNIAAKNIGASNEINWTTGEETKGDYFELERGSDGKNFSKIDRISGKEKPSDYVYDDNNPLSGVNFYRLKVLDANGTFVYSKVVQAIAGKNGNVSIDVYPNPTKGSVTLKVYGSGNGTVILTDISGRTVRQTTMAGSEMPLDMSSLENGFYLVHYVDDNMNKVIKINKQ